MNDCETINCPTCGSSVDETFIEQKCPRCQTLIESKFLCGSCHNCAETITDKKSMAPVFSLNILKRVLMHKLRLEQSDKQ